MYTPEEEFQGPTQDMIKGGTPGGGLSSFAGGPLGMVGKFASGALNKWLAGKEQNRQAQNKLSTDIAAEQNFDPNRRLYDATGRNIRGGFITNLQNAMQGGKMPGIENMGLARAYLNSIGNVNPQLVGEMSNIAGIPGLRIGGKEIAPNIRPELETAGFGESMAAGLAGLFS